MKKFFKKLGRYLIYLVGGYFCAVFVLGIVSLFMMPLSTLIMAERVSGDKVVFKNVPLERVSRNLIRAVISAEDDRFCEHHGIDFYSMQKAVDRADNGGRILGASTISMQVAKNIFLWPQRSYLRKLLEMPIAVYLDLLWSKHRMLEVYLSIAEWGDGIFGIEAASQKYFHKSAADLNAWEAAQLAAALPNPRERNPSHPTEYQNSYARLILRRMNNGVNTSCLSH